MIFCCFFSVLFMYLHLFLQVIEKQIKMDGEISEYGVWARGAEVVKLWLVMLKCSFQIWGPFNSET